ncbi:hypothetical protein DMJ13_18060 [halophilic archaeon]|nr:hypothetical protein DMJ13_18060 [halophilic archaeon]
MLDQTRQPDLPTLDPGIPLFEEDDLTTGIVDLFQTTLAYWQYVLTARHPTLASTSTQEVTAYGTD